MSISSVTQQLVNTSSGAAIKAPELPKQGASGTATVSTFQSASPAPTSPTKTVEQLSADKQNLFNLVDQLRQMNTRNDGKPLTPPQISSALKSQIEVPFAGSTYALASSTPPTLATAITDLGFELPTTGDQLSSLANQIEQQASTPALGNFGGARSWPIPMPQEDQERIRAFLFSSGTGVPGLPLPRHGNGTLHYLMEGVSLTHSELQNPSLALQKLLDSPKAQVLGQALQAHLKGIPTESSIYDYLLTAINIRLDPDSIWFAERNKIAGNQLDEPSHWGESPSLVVECLGGELIHEGRATPATVKLATHLLLGRLAPQYLIKDIPKHVTVGGILWSQLTIAASKIEAQTPGKVASMTYVEVLAAAESLPSDTVDVQVAQREALKDWGVAKGILTLPETSWRGVDGRFVPIEHEPSETDIERVRVAYNSRLQALTTASTSLYTPIPNRKAIALRCLKEEFPELDPKVFEAKVLAKRYTGEGRAPTGDPRPRSMLDVAMEGEKLGEKFKWITNDSRVPIDAFNNFARTDKLTVPNTEFNSEYDPAIKAQKEGNYLMVKHLISELPLADQKNLEYGKLEYFSCNDYKKTAGNRIEKVNRGHVLYVKTTFKDKDGGNLYKFDASTGTVTKENDRLKKLFDPVDNPKPNEQSEQTFSLIEAYHPFTDSPAPNSEENKNATAIPKSYDSDRTNNIADFYVKSLKLDDESLLNYSKGVTSFDHDRSGDAAIGQFLLNLIPFRSAIVNLGKGNYGDTVKDLALDIFGLLTVGVGKAAQAVKGLGHGLNATSKITRAVKFVGTAAIDVLNPLNGPVGAIALGGTLINKTFTKGAELVNKLKGATGSYELLKVASKNQGVVATGTYKGVDGTYEGAAVLHEGKWYGYSPITGRHYGKPLAMFTPQSVAMAGVMQDYKVLGTGLAMSADTTKRGLRLTLDAHGHLNKEASSALMAVNGTELTPNELFDLLKAQGVKLDKYVEIRLTMCHSASGGANSFAAQFAKITHKPVEGFVGKMHVNNPVMEDLAARTFANKARLRDYIDDTVIGKRKHQAVKYIETGRTADGRSIYTHSPDYNPVRFDADGVPLPAKPKLPSYTDTVARPKVEFPAQNGEASKVNFEDYDDLT